MGLVLRQEILQARMTDERKDVFAHYLIQLVSIHQPPSDLDLSFISQMLASEQGELFRLPYALPKTKAKNSDSVCRTERAIESREIDNQLDSETETFVLKRAGRQNKWPLGAGKKTEGTNNGKVSLERLSELWCHAELFLSTSICLAALDGNYSVEQARLISDYAHRLGFSAYRLSILEREIFQVLHQVGSSIVYNKVDSEMTEKMHIPCREQIYQASTAEDVFKKNESQRELCTANRRSAGGKEKSNKDECLHELRMQQLWNSDLEIVTKVEKGKNTD